MRRGGPAAAALAVAAMLAALPLAAATKKPAPERPKPAAAGEAGAGKPLSPTASLEKRVREVKLGNGMRFLLLRRGTAPVFAGILRFKVGSADDPGGETGLAHLFEHMAFKGTTKIGVTDAAKEAPILDALDGVARDLNAELDRGPRADAARLDALRAKMKSLMEEHRALVVRDEFSEILSENGATGINASTGADMTSYYVSLPANRIELWCLLEAARLKDPVLREFYSERDVVKEERRFRIDNQPQGKLYEQLLLTAYSAHPYRIPGAGWLSDLDRLTRPEAEAFHREHYVPGNAVGALVGQIDTETTAALLERYFSGIPAGPLPLSTPTVEPAQTGERRVAVQFDAAPNLMMGFHKTALDDPQDPVFEVIDSLLGGGRTSRLFRKLVTGSGVASNVFTFEAPGRRFPSLFVIGGQPRAPHTTADLEQGILEELRRLGEEPVSDQELAKVRAQIESDSVYQLRGNMGLAGQLTQFALLTGDWRTMIRRDEQLKAITAKQVQEVARQTFTAANRTVATLERPADEGDKPAQAPPGQGR
ncbi:MAG TPA: pitrilysin family protein [Candidatus Polarisedimenticolia bacterium]|nr:pitrilysin family protein [Candidatus Polarisedimenticolia bacterium]